jgi:hypothetical protein
MTLRRACAIQALAVHAGHLFDMPSAPFRRCRRFAASFAFTAWACAASAAAEAPVPPGALLQQGDGWDVRITALGDFDRDGRPDFLFAIGGSNARHLALVLSSVARPGCNPPTAYLTATGC